MMLAPNTRLGPYEILSPLGVGGMGEVYRARDTRLGREVAIKVLPEGFADDPERLKRFEQEARAVAALDHPNILALYDVGTHEGAPYIVTQLLEGESLRERLSGGAMPIRKAVEVAVQIAQGLAAAHEKGIVHRDLKPANVFITKDGHVKILDFGIAKLVAPRSLVEPAQATTVVEATEAGATLGTVGYMAPEQVRGQSVDHRSDIFSFGCVLYEMLSGRSPFRRDTAAETMTAILHDEPPPLPSNIPRGLDRAVRRCLEKSPDDRFQSARDLGFALQAEAEALTAPSLLRSARLPRRWLWAGLAALGVVAAVAVALYLLTVRGHAGAPTAAGLIRSIAVLPLANLSGDPGQEYFSDGMTEELITALSKISALKVISRTSVMQFKGSKKPLRGIAAALGVEGVIEGSVLRAGERVRITAQLINAATDTHLWAESYERDLKDVLEVQSSVAHAIAGEIRIKVTPAEQRLLEASPAVNAEAHDAWARGNYHLNKGTEEDLKRAIEYFDQALEKAPGFAQAYVGLGATYVAFCPGYRSPRQVIPQAREAAIKALELDDNMAEAHALLGAIRVSYDWDWSSAEKEFRRAIELNASSASAHEGYAAYYSAVGKSRDAVGEMKRAQELDPLSMGAIMDRAWTLYMAQAYDEAMEQCRRDLDISPSYGFAHGVLGMIALEHGQRELALSEARRGVEVDASPFNLAMLGTAEAVLGMRAEALTVVDTLKKRSAKEYVCLYELGVIEACLGQKDRAFQWLNRACDDRDVCVMWLNADPRLKSLHSDPRFRDLLARVGFPT